jgi:ATP/ADP translocase
VRIKTLGKVLIISSPLVFVANFLTLANNLFTKSERLRSLGSAVAAACFLSFIAGLLTLIIGKIKEKPTEVKEAVGIYPLLSKVKLILALVIFLWLFVIFPINRAIGCRSFTSG